MRWFVLFFIVGSSAVFAEESEPFLTPPSAYELSDLDVDQDLLVRGVVNPLSGQVCIKRRDLTVRGAQDIHLDRIYISPRSPVSFHADSELDHLYRYQYLHETYRGWVTLPHLLLTVAPHTHQVRLVDHHGSVVEFEQKNNRFVFASGAAGISNLSGDTPSGRHDSRNIKVEELAEEFTVTLPDGSFRRYTLREGFSYLLTYERLPNGKILRYRYDNGRLSRIESCDPQERFIYASLAVEGTTRSAKQRFQGSNGTEISYAYSTKTALGKGRDGRRQISYEIQSPPFLAVVQNPAAYEESFAYSSGLDLVRYQSVSTAFELKLEGTDLWQVTSLRLPTGTEGDLVEVAQLAYHPSIPGKTGAQTLVRHEDGTQTVYRYSENLLLEGVDAYDPKGVLKHSKRLTWNGDQRLQSVELMAEDGKLHCRKTYEYDVFGNPVYEEQTARFISDKLQTRWIKREFSLDGKNLLLSEAHEEGLTYHWEYLPGTCLPRVKHTCDNQRVILREVWDYDDCHNLVFHLRDSGDSSGGTEERFTRYRLRQEAPFLHMPEWIEEGYREDDQEYLLGMRKLNYDKYGHVSEEEVHNAHGHHLFTLFREYNDQGALISETNPLGQKATYCYDDRGNRTLATSFSGKLRTEYAYDARSNLIEKREIDPDGTTFTTSYEYDLNDLLVAKTSRGDHVTRFIQDPIARKPRFIEYSSSESHSICYDSFGRAIAKTDARGQTTHYAYNAFGSPLKIVYPDESSENFTYSKAGYLLEHRDQLGRVTTYQRDLLGRVLRKTLHSFNGYPIGEEIYRYNAFHLLEKIDQEGYHTRYQYDGAGRITLQEREGRRREYAYDAQGRLNRLTESELVTCYQYDLLDRVIEEAKLDPSGRLLSQTRFGYDDHNNRNAVIGWADGQEISEKWVYDAFNRVTSHENALGEYSCTRYDDHWQDAMGRRVLKETHSSFAGIKTVKIYDPFQRCVSEQSYSPTGHLLAHRGTEYDQNGNIVTITDHVIQEGKEVSLQTITYTYNSMNQVASETRGAAAPDIRTTSYTYTLSGKLATKRLPDGCLLRYAYDDQDQLMAISSVDEAIHYSFSYNRLGHLLGAIDHNLGLNLRREVDPFGNILFESWSNGLFIQKEYDALNRPLFLQFPGGAIRYSYDALFLRSVERLSQEGERLYIHRYDRYDLSGHLLQETPVGDLGQVLHRYDAIGRQTSISSPYFLESCRYDQKGNLIERELKGHRCHYTYDDLSQLIDEPDRVYEYDSQYRRTSRNAQELIHNSLNERISTSLRYDANGNLVRNGTWEYSFDPLSQLYQASSSDQKIRFIYDPLGRRTAKEEGTLTKEMLLYDGANELAIYTSDGHLKALRVPGLFLQRGTTLSVAIELDGEVFVPFTDSRRNICRLVEMQSGVVTHEYSYSAFGTLLQSNETKFNPWQYAGKPLDSELKLLYFGKRYYSPELATWLSPDPAGILDSTNPYQYVLNNPLKYIDPRGEDVFGFLVGIGAMCGGAVIMGSGVVLEVASCGGYTIAFGWQESLGLSLMAYGCGLATYHAQDISFSPRFDLHPNAFPSRLELVTNVYTPDRPLPKYEGGEPCPEADAPHTQIGIRGGRNGAYPQAREFDANGKPVRDIDFTDHGRPDQHPNPHQHRYEENGTGGTRKRSKFAEPVADWEYQ